MEFQGTRVERYGPIGQNLSSMIELHYRAELAEALLSERPTPRTPIPKEWLEAKKIKTPRSPVEVVLEQLSEHSKSQRKEIANKLMTVDLRSGKLLSEQDRTALKKLVEPNSKTPMMKRSNVFDKITDVLTADGEFKKWDIKKKWDYWTDIAVDISPEHEWVFEDRNNPLMQDVLVDEDGRPDDAEPDDPPPMTPTPTTPPPPSGTPSGSPSTISPGYEGLQLHIERVRCLRETRGEAGADEMSAGGVAVHGPLYLSANPSVANGDRFGGRGLGSFRTNDQEIYNPSIEMHEYDLTGVSLPHMFMAWFTLAERDQAGGFSEYLSELETSIQAEISALDWNLVFTASYFSALMVGAGVWLIVVTAMAGAIGALIFSIIYVAAALFIWIATFFIGNKDDIFELREILLPLDQFSLQGDPFNGTPQSRTMEMIIEGDGGRYDVKYFWRLVRPTAFFSVFDEDAILTAS